MVHFLRVVLGSEANTHISWQIHQFKLKLFRVASLLILKIDEHMDF